MQNDPRVTIGVKIHLPMDPIGKLRRKPLFPNHFFVIIVWI